MQKYLKIFNLAVLHSVKNYKALIGLSIFFMTCLLIFSHILKIATAQTDVINLPSERLLWYIAFNEWVLISLPDVQDEMEQDLRSGKLAYLLPRPISYLGAVFFEGLGILCTNLFMLGIVAFCFIWLHIGQIPFGFTSFLIIIALSLLAGCVALIFQMQIGLSAFWLQHVGPFHWIWEKLLFTLGGLMLPLTVYPTWLQILAYLTPFPAILGQRSALAIDFNLFHVLQITSSLIAWGIFGFVGLTLIYRRGLRIFNVLGG